jgi:hypothetical protein
LLIIGQSLGTQQADVIQFDRYGDQVLGQPNAVYVDDPELLHYQSTYMDVPSQNVDLEMVDTSVVVPNTGSTDAVHQDNSFNLGHDQAITYNLGPVPVLEGNHTTCSLPIGGNDLIPDGNRHAFNHSPYLH